MDFVWHPGVNPVQMKFDSEWVRVRMSGLLNVAKTQPSTPNAFRGHFAKCHTNIRTCLLNDKQKQIGAKKKKHGEKQDVTTKQLDGMTQYG